jgi:hypothetical protein
MLVAFCCFSPLSLVSYHIATLLVLDRLMHFSKLKGASAKSFWAVWWRVLVGVAVVGAVVSVCCNIAASRFFLASISIFDGIVSAGVENATTANQATEQNAKAAHAGAFMFGFEALILPVIIVSFFAVGVSGARRIRLAASSPQEHAAIGTEVNAAGASARQALERQQLMRKVAGTCVVTLLSLLLRAVDAIMCAPHHPTQYICNTL